MNALELYTQVMLHCDLLLFNGAKFYPKLLKSPTCSATIGQFCGTTTNHKNPIWSNDVTNQNEHWNENVVILTKFLSLASLEVVILTTSSAANDENFIKMKTFPFQWMQRYPWPYYMGCTLSSQLHSRMSHLPYPPTKVQISWSSCWPGWKFDAVITSSWTIGDEATEKNFLLLI